MARKIKYSTFVSNILKKLESGEYGYICNALKSVLKQSIPNHSQYELRFKRYIKSLLRQEDAYWRTIYGDAWKIKSRSLSGIFVAKGYITLQEYRSGNVSSVGCRIRLLKDYIAYLKARKQ